MNDLTMPWKKIAKATAYVAGFTAFFLTAASAAAISDERRTRDEEARFRWTDVNRWER